MAEEEIEIELSEEAEKFYCAKERYSALIGGFGSGKTHLLCMEAIKCAIDNVGAPGMMVAPTYKMIRDPLLDLFEAILQKQEIQYKLVKNPDIVLSLYHNGNYHNKITFRSADRPKSLRGPTLSFFGIDEAAMVDKDAWTDCVSRLRHGGARYCKGFIGTTPEGIDDWIYDEFVEKCEDGKRDGVYSRFHIDSRDNPSNSPEYIAALVDAYDATILPAYLSGEFIDMSTGRAYYSFGTHNIKELQYNPHLKLCLTCDFNVEPMVWEIFQYGRNRIEFFDEIYIRTNASTATAIQMFCEKYFAWMKHNRDNKRVQVNIFGDSSGKARTTAGDSDYVIIRETLNTNGIPWTGYVPDENPRVRDRLNTVNGALQDRGNATKVFVDPRCKRLIKDYKLVVLRKNGDIDKGNEKSRRELTHASDAAGYAIYQIMPIKHTRISQPAMTISRF